MIIAVIRNKNPQIPRAAEAALQRILDACLVDLASPAPSLLTACFGGGGGAEGKVGRFLFGVGDSAFGCGMFKVVGFGTLRGFAGFVGFNSGYWV